MVFEVVSGQLRIGARSRFRELHAQKLLPAYRKAGIRVVAALMTEVGSFGKFVDIYEYRDFGDYEARSSLVAASLEDSGYYPEIQECIVGSISIELMESFLSGQ